MSKNTEILKQILNLADQFIENKEKKTDFNVVPITGKVIGKEEARNMIEASLDGWLTTGRFNEKFEKKLSNFLNVKNLITTNSGSSANLVAFNTLTSPKLGERAIKKGDEVITVAAGFPTTINPSIQFGAIPVFIDVKFPTYNINEELIENAITKKTKCIMIAHTFGNPFNLDKILEICKKYNLWLVEDTCDALGSKYKDKFLGTFGDLASLSFYPAHHITMGEGGAVFTNNIRLKKIAESFRDWGRDCYCEPGKDNTCGKRFKWQLGDLPYGYDHKYTYSHLGFNLKITDMQAACGLAQLDRLENFIQARKNNFAFLYERLKKLDEYLILPEKEKNSEPSWFGFPLTIRDINKFDRTKLMQYLNENNIGTRLLFGGNVIKQPYMKDVKYRVGSKLENTEIVMSNTFWIGLFPGLTNKHLEHSSDKIISFFKNK